MDAHETEGPTLRLPGGPARPLLAEAPAGGPEAAPTRLEHLRSILAVLSACARPATTMPDAAAVEMTAARQQSAEQAGLLASFDCDIGQGHLSAPPGAASEPTRLLAEMAPA